MTLAEMKTYLRVEHDDEDELIGRLIAAARQACESATRRAFLTQSWRLTRARWPHSGQIDVPLAPLAAVTAARIRNADGAETEVDPARFKVVAGAAPGLILARRPLPAPAGGTVELDLVAGYGDSAASVPADLVEAVRRLAARLYDSRGLDAAAMPADVAALLQPHRVVAL
ncbi:gene transfer agent protein [Blastochloris viridis]|uniref:Gene transfer agent protein n=1 Tax=Blastochloris viridis TaxID=1079 RepID=A0A182D365_BLAVI|nr:gene transfer agent protein [Blastochloris viridis]